MPVSARVFKMQKLLGKTLSFLGVSRGKGEKSLPRGGTLNPRPRPGVEGEIGFLCSGNALVKTVKIVLKHGYIFCLCVCSRGGVEILLMNMKLISLPRVGGGGGGGGGGRGGLPLHG